MIRVLKFAALLAAGAALLLPSGLVRASSHSDAPLIKQDPQANLTDVFTFVSNNAAGVKVLNVIVNVHPFCEPGDGAIYDRFADDALYSLFITDPKTGRGVLRYDFTFSAVNGGYKNVNTILSYGLGTEVGAIQDVGDAHQNFTQTYNITRTIGNQSSPISSGTTLMCAPPNVGLNTTPYYNDANGRAVSGAPTAADLDHYTAETIYNLPSGETVWAGPRDDGFFADAPGIFDLLNSRILGPDGAGQTGNGVDGFKGYNVLTYGIQIPITQLAKVWHFPTVGVYASVSRRQVRLLGPTPGDMGRGEWVQVNRLGNPLFNEALVATKDKDNYNFDKPQNDATKYATYALNPELAALINAVYGLGLQATNRTDLVGIFIPDVIRVDTSTPPVPLAGQTGFNRLSVFGGDTINNGAGQMVPSGWPNGRRFGDDVVDIALTAIASPPGSPVFVLGDNVNFNDATFNQVFPFEATPNSGTHNRKDPPAGPSP
jgi:hypothetical protein